MKKKLTLITGTGVLLISYSLFICMCPDSIMLSMCLGSFILMSKFLNLHEQELK